MAKNLFRVHGVDERGLEKRMPQILEDAENGLPGISRELFADTMQLSSESVCTR